MNHRALVIINPYAGTMKSRKNMFEIVDRLSQKNYSVSIQTTTKPLDGTLFVKKYGADQDLIICCGGDGTLNEVINGVLEMGSQTPVGYVPAGTTNDFARTLKLPQTVEKAMDRILGGYPHFYDIGSFNNRNFTYIASLGAFTKVSYSTPQKLKNALGHTAYLLEGVKEIGNISPFQASLQVGGKTIEGEFVFGAISNSTSVAGLFKLNGLDVRLDDGEFELILVRNPKSPMDLNGIVQGLVKNKFDPRYVVFTHGEEFRFHSDVPLPWTLDGESGGEQTDVRIRVLHNAIQLMI